MALSDQLNVVGVLERMERLPRSYRLGVVAVVFLAVIVVYWLSVYGGQRQKLHSLESQLTTLQSKINESRAVASNLKSFEQKRQQLREELATALRRLPDKNELPVLLTDITSLGKKSGLEFRAFRPREEITRGFYAEVPISIELQGTYHDVGIFFDRLAVLSRIVNITDLEMRIANYKTDVPRLGVKGVATTFRFVEGGAKKSPTGGE